MDDQLIRAALKRAFLLGQTYWQQADSEYQSQWKKADVTQAQFRNLVEETCAAIAAAVEDVYANPRNLDTSVERVQIIHDSTHEAIQPDIEGHPV